MAEAAQAKADAPAESAGRPPKKKKSRPTNCLQSNKRIRRKDWYYRNGRYFANKQCFRLWEEAEKAKKAKEEEAAKAAKAAAEAKPAEAEKPAAEAAG